MKPAKFLRYVVLPAAAVAVGVKLGIKYAQKHYVVKDRKFIESEVRNSQTEKRRDHAEDS